MAMLDSSMSEDNSDGHHGDNLIATVGAEDAYSPASWPTAGPRSRAALRQYLQELAHEHGEVEAEMTHFDAEVHDPAAWTDYDWRVHRGVGMGRWEPPPEDPREYRRHGTILHDPPEEMPP